MKTLAQEYLERGFPTEPALRSEWRSIAMTCHSVLREALSPPDLKKLAKATDTTELLAFKAERFAFIQNPIDTVGALLDNKSLDHKTVLELARLPASVCWVEWPNWLDGRSRQERLGILVIPGTIDMTQHRNIDGHTQYKVSVGPGVPIEKQRMFIIGAASLHEDVNAVCPFMLLSCDAFSDVARGFSGVDMHWFIDGISKDRREQAADTLLDFCDALFLINTPRVSEIKKHVPSEKLQKARVRSGKLPMIEYRQVNITVGVGPTHYTNKQSAAPLVRQEGESVEAFERRRRRLHRVIPHFRTYRNDDGTAKRVVPIAEQWRGDASLGVVLHDRKIKPPPDKLK
jgi:hypothetical protein